MDGMLSQEEINALLNGEDGSSETTSKKNDSAMSIEDALTPMGIDIMGEVSNICMGTAATTLYTLVNQKVDITTPRVELATWNELVNEYDRPCVFIQIFYREGINGSNVFILKDTDVKVIADLMMGGDGTNIEGEVSDLHLSAISEAMNQMMGTAATSLSSLLGTKIDISPPVANTVNMDEDIDVSEIASFLNEEFVRVAFKMKVGDLVDSQIMQLYPIDLCRTLCEKFNLGNAANKSETEQEETVEPTQSQSVMPTQSQPIQPQPVMPDLQSMPNMQIPVSQGMNYGMPTQSMPMQNVNVQQAQFQEFSPDIVAVNQRENINLIMDVPLEVTVELGRTKKTIQDILEFSPGTIIELDKIAGEPVDVLVNGKYVAKGEVVVIEESFGVRVTEIIR